MEASGKSSSHSLRCAFEADMGRKPVLSLCPSHELMGLLHHVCFYHRFLLSVSPKWYIQLTPHGNLWKKPSQTLLPLFMFTIPVVSEQWKLPFHHLKHAILMGELLLSASSFKINWENDCNPHPWTRAECQFYSGAAEQSFLCIMLSLSPTCPV